MKESADAQTGATGNESAHRDEVRRGLRFTFGDNWSRFLSVLNEQRIAEAEASLRNLLELDSLEGKRFLDIGCGSGLFSLAARRLGAAVHSLDYDPQSVACATELKRRYFPDDPNWVIESGSALDDAYMGGLEPADIVYTWGVLHHTGNMWKAMKLAQQPVKDGGQFVVALYNDQGKKSIRWRRVKRVYCHSPSGKALVCSIFIPYFVIRPFFRDLLHLKNPFKRYADYKKKRGMSVIHDWHDWLGGYPFDVVRPEQVFGFYRNCGFLLKQMILNNSSGNSQFVFVKQKTWFNGLPDES